MITERRHRYAANFEQVKPEERTDTRKVPDWIHQQVSLYADLYGLDAWKLFVSLEDKPGEDGDATATTDLALMEYRQAYFAFQRDFAYDAEGTLEGRQVIHHEVLHVGLALMRQACERIMSMLSEPQRELAHALYRDAEEATIEQIVRSLDSYIGDLSELRTHVKKTDDTESEDSTSVLVDFSASEGQEIE